MMLGRVGSLPAALVLTLLVALVTACSSGITSPRDNNISLEDLEAPSYYTEIALYTFSRSESLVVVRFGEGVSDKAATAELAARGFEFRYTIGSNPELTVASTDGMARHFPLLRRSRLVEWATPVLLSSDERARYPFNRLSVGFAEGVSREECVAKIRSVGGRRVSTFGPRGYDFEIAWSRADSVFTIGREMHDDPRVVYAHPSMYFELGPW